MAGAAQPIIGRVEPQPAALMRADSRHGFGFAVDAANDGRTALEQLRRPLGRECSRPGLRERMGLFGGLVGDGPMPSRL